MKSFAFLIPLLTAASVTAHGYLSAVTIDGQTFRGINPSGRPGASIIRKTNSASPIKGARNPALSCGPGAGPASLTAVARPGSQLSFMWKEDNNAAWPHDTGAMQTYMASCGNGGCEKFDSSQAQWFKIGALARRGGAWIQGDLRRNIPVPATIPSNLAAGNYLLRHEIIALHLAERPGGAEFYAGCAQVRVTGGGTGRPKSSDLARIPGAYNDNDPGILTSHAFDPRDNYKFPGPALVSLVAGPAVNGNTETDTVIPTATTATVAASATESAANPAGTGHCHLTPKTPENNPNNSGSEPPYPRQLSRVMRELYKPARLHAAGHQSH